ncbi:hypothetical protein FNF31_01172 [Cafeteria roenbergensis]|uniref:Uncharacterized protein n=1 Tax=Cafeteria roenbergensis TaxID=33653 RepID=A0A5A8DQA3_CAFRO|nr:hypothetical protein FNF31_01172 [Cafeteria roenbergensis]
MDDPRLRRVRTRPERPLLDWTRVKETAAHWWHLVHKPWPSAAIDTTLDWERAKLVWKTRNVDPHAWSPLRCAWAAIGAAHRVEPAAAAVGLAAGAGAAFAWRSLRGRLFVVAAACAAGRYAVLVPVLAASVYNDKSWHPALEDPSHVFTPWRREHRRGVDQAARLAMLPAHLLASALGPAAVALALAYVASSPALSRYGLYHRMARVSALERRAVRRLRAETALVAADAPSLRPAEALRVARLRLSGAITPATGSSAAAADGAAVSTVEEEEDGGARGNAPLSKWWVVTEYGHPALDDTSPEGVTRR